MDIAQTPPEAELIEAHKLAKRKLAKAKVLATGVPLVLVLALIGYVWWAAVDFFKNKAPQVISSVMKQAPDELRPVLGEATAAVGRVVPVYQKAIGEVVQRDMPIYKKLVESQKQGFIEYARGMHKKIVDRFGGLEDKILTNVEKHLAPGMLAEERKIFEREVADALYARLEQEVQANWDIQLKQVKAISDDFNTIALNTPPLKSDKPRYLAGIGLELLGLKLQEYAK